MIVITSFDFHIHSKKTSKAVFTKHDFFAMIKQATTQNLDLIAITEHAHAKNFSGAYDYLYQNYEYINNYYLVDGIKVFTGVEISVAEGFDIVCIGNRNLITTLHSKCPNLRGELSFNQLMPLLDENLFVILAHPFRKHQIVDLEPYCLAKIDCVEINANDLSKCARNNPSSLEDSHTQNESLLAHKAKCEHLGYMLNKPTIANSDAHIPSRVGCCKTTLFVDVIALDDIKKALKDGLYEVEITDSI